MPALAAGTSARLPDVSGGGAATHRQYDTAGGDGAAMAAEQVGFSPGDLEARVLTVALRKA